MIQIYIVPIFANNISYVPNELWSVLCRIKFSHSYYRCLVIVTDMEKTKLYR